MVKSDYKIENKATYKILPVVDVIDDGKDIDDRIKWGSLIVGR